MKLAVLLPGYLDSPEYTHMVVFEKRLKEIGYEVKRIDPCKLWETGNAENYNITNYLKDVEETIPDNNYEEVVLIGHSLGGFVAILAGEKFKKVDKIVSLCPPPSIEGLASKWGNNEYKVSQRNIPGKPNQYRKFKVPKSTMEDGLNYSALNATENINKPLMILIALDDKTVPPSETEKLIQKANKPHVVKLPNLDHNFRKSREESERVMDEIEKFLY